eukprot:1160713-Pelagomonas_calceolata.AAC.3
MELHAAKGQKTLFDFGCIPSASAQRLMREARPSPGSSSPSWSPLSLPMCSSGSSMQQLSLPPTGSQAARGRGRGTRKQACAPSRGGEGRSRGKRTWAAQLLIQMSQTQRKRPQRRRPWKQTEGLHELK